MKLQDEIDIGKSLINIKFDLIISQNNFGIIIKLT